MASVFFYPKLRLDVNSFLVYLYFVYVEVLCSFINWNAALTSWCRVIPTNLVLSSCILVVKYRRGFLLTQTNYLVNEEKENNVFNLN